MNILREQKLYVNHKKTQLFVPYDEKFNILVMEIQNREYKPEDKKINAFGALPSPSSFQELGRDLRAFMWLTSHLPFTNSTVAPLYILLHLDR